MPVTASAVATLRVRHDRSTIGTPLEPSNVISRLHNLLADAKLPRQHFHEVPHCTASLLLVDGVASRTVMAICRSPLLARARRDRHMSRVLTSWCNSAALRTDAPVAVVGIGSPPGVSCCR